MLVVRKVGLQEISGKGRAGARGNVEREPGVERLVLPDEVQVQPCTSATDQRPDVADRWAIWRAEKARRAADDRGRGVGAAAVFHALSVHLPENAVVTVDVDNHAYSLGRYLESKGQPVLVKYGIPIKHVLLNNHALGKISKEQLAEDYPVWHTSLHNPDWAGYARLCGATGIRVTSRDQLDEAMSALFASDGPA